MKTYSKFTIIDFFSFKKLQISSDCSNVVGCDITILIAWLCVCGMVRLSAGDDEGVCGEEEEVGVGGEETERRERW